MPGKRFTNLRCIINQYIDRRFVGKRLSIANSFLLFIQNEINRKIAFKLPKIAFSDTLLLFYFNLFLPPYFNFKFILTNYVYNSDYS